MRQSRALSHLVALLLLSLASPSEAGLARLSPSKALSNGTARLDGGSFQFPRGAADGLDLDSDRSLAPYLEVRDGDPSLDRLPLKETSARVQIVGVIAQVKVRQVFENDGLRPIDAVYVFPASTRAAVHGMRMRIGDRTIEAKIEKKAEARKQYEAARVAGKRASLLEQDRPNVFTMSVANLVPGDRIEVELDYSELLVPKEGDYEFVYPTVVGPRYEGDTPETFAASPQGPAGLPEPYRFDLEVRLESAIPIKELDSPSHELHIRRPSPESAVVDLAKSGGGDRDFVLRYRLAGDEIESGLLLYEDPTNESEKYFLLMVEPPQKPRPEQITPREFVFLLDVSCSMQGDPLQASKTLMGRLLGQLGEDDYFNIAFFEGGSWLMSEAGSLPATEGNIEEALARLDEQEGGGGTELMDGLRTAYAAPRPHEAVSRSVIVVTDGYVTVENQAFKWIREHLDETNVFAFGIGQSVNRALIEGMARAGQGEPFIVLRSDEAGGVAEHLAEYVREPVISGLEYGFEDFRAIEVAPGALPDLMARRPVILFGKYKGEAEGSITLEGQNADGLYREVVEVADYRPEEKNAPIRHLWARKWVSTLSDELVMTGDAPELVHMITRLGLSHQLLTRYTSFVAVDSAVVNEGGRADGVRQPLPMPAGVTDPGLARARRGYSSSGGLGLKRQRMITVIKGGSGSGSGGGSAGGGYTRPAPSGAGRTRTTLQTVITGERTKALGTKRQRMITVIKGGSGETTSSSSPPTRTTPPETSRSRTTYQTLLTGDRTQALGQKRQKMIDVHEGTSGKTKKVVAEPTGGRDGPNFLVTEFTPAHLSTPRGMLEALQKHFGGLARACFAKGKKIQLQLTFDATGHVTTVKVLGGDAVLGRCLAPKMKGLETGVTVESPKASVTLELIVI